MKNYKTLALAILATTAIATPLAAQAETKGPMDQKIMNDAQRMDTDTIQPRVMQAPQEKTMMQNTISDVEPEAGNPFADFTGFYAGANAGYSLTDDLDGWSGGPFIGYGFDHDFGMFGSYIGVEGGYDWSRADGTSGGVEYEKDGAWQVSLRPGVTIMDDGLAYAVLGYTRANFESAGDDADLDGYILGLGAQLDTNTPFKTRVEYNYINYEDENIGGTNVDAEENIVKVGAVFQF